MMKNANQFKKFQFFEVIEGDARSNHQNAELKSKVNYILNDVTPLDMKTIDNYLFLSAKVSVPRSENVSSKKPQIRIKKDFLLKLYKSKILDQYEIYNNSIIAFELKSIEDKKYLIAFGSDKTDQGNSETPSETPSASIVSSLKIFDITQCLDTKTEAKPELLKTLNIMRTVNNTLSSDTATTSPVEDVMCFSVSEEMTAVAIGCSKGDVIVIKSNENLLSVKDSDVVLLKKQSDDCITNIAFSIQRDLYVTYSTEKDIFYYNVNDKSNTATSMEADCGVAHNCFSMNYKENKFLITTQNDNYVNEYQFFEKGPIWCFDGFKKLISYFKNYIVFVIYEEGVSSLAVYDPINQIFVYYSSNFSNITALTCDADTIFILDQNEVTNQKKLLRFREKENKEKFDTFYKKSFFDTAYNYAKNLNYDQKKISEISKRHAEHLYKKGEYEKSIEQYIRTINYLDPSYVIQKFLDGSKLDFLIKYLETLNKDENMRKKCQPEEMKDYTALLLNCYIKQKKIDKLREFVEQKDITEQPKVLETAIEVCKDTKETDLALSIAEKSHMTDYYIQILMEMKDDYDNSLLKLQKEEDKMKQFKLFMKYGSQFLDKKPQKTMEVLEPLLNALIQIKNGNPMEDLTKEQLDQFSKLKYESIVTIFSNRHSKELEKVLDLIMEKDEHCPSLIIHRRIELYLEKLKSTDIADDNYKVTENIKALLRNEKYQTIMDKNYLLMLFKIYNYTNGITELSEIMELKQELLQIYMENHNYDKIIDVCKRYGQYEVNYWVQALNYFIGITTVGTKSFIEKYIKQILNEVSKNESISPLLLLEIIKKGQNVPFATVKEILINFFKRNKDALMEDKREAESNALKLQKLEQEQKELQQKAKTFASVKCSTCGNTLNVPFVYFMCSHACHVQCLSGDEYDEIYCNVCKMKKTQLEMRINQSKELANDHNSFFTDLKNKQKKFDLVAKYMGKGIFDMTKDKTQ